MVEALRHGNHGGGDPSVLPGLHLTIQNFKMTAFKNSKPRLGIFFTHPTQHHSVMFNLLLDDPGSSVEVNYFDPGATAHMFDAGFGKNVAWDIPLMHPRARVLWNPLRTDRVVHWRQVCPGVILACFSKRYDWVWLGSYSSPASFFALISSKMVGSKIIFQADTNVLNERRKKRSIWFRLYTAIFLRLVDRYLAIGDLNRDFYLMRDCDTRKIRFCPYPTDVHRITERALKAKREGEDREIRSRYHIPVDAVVIVFCGKLIERKRPRDFLAAVLGLIATSKVPVFGLLVGSGPLEKDLGNEIPLGAPLAITGFVNQRDIPAYFAASDVGIVCSDYDPHPLVCTEMAACGLPLVVSHFCGVYGPHDIVREGENGLIYECGNIQDLVEKLSALVNSTDLRTRFGDRGVALASLQDAAIAARVVCEVINE